MSIHEVSRRLIRKFPITYYANGVLKNDYMKVGNLQMEVARKTAKYNRMGAVLPESPIRPGNLVDFGGHKYIVGSSMPDVYKGIEIRHNCELFFCENQFDFFRMTIQRDAYGNILGEGSVPVVAGVWGSINPSDIFVKGDKDIVTEYLHLWFSREVVGVEIDDRVFYCGAWYEMKFFRYDTPGVTVARLERLAT